MDPIIETDIFIEKDHVELVTRVLFEGSHKETEEYKTNYTPAQVEGIRTEEQWADWAFAQVKKNNKVKTPKGTRELHNTVHRRGRHWGKKERREDARRRKQERREERRDRR